VRRPRASQRDVVFPVEKVRRVARVERHGLKALMLLQHSTSPLPNAAQIGLTTELAALVSHRHWVPAFEAHIGSVQVDKEVVWVGTGDCARGTFGQRLGWRGLIHPIIDQMAVEVSCV
jgi:hypothetical protein